MAEKQGMTPEELAELRADFKTAMFAGGGLALSIIGLLLGFPIASVAGMVFAFFGFRVCRPDYRMGKVTSVIGMVAGGVGLALLVVNLVAAS